MVPMSLSGNAQSCECPDHSHRGLNCGAALCYPLAVAKIRNHARHLRHETSIRQTTIAGHSLTVNAGESQNTWCCNERMSGYVSADQYCI